MNERPGPLILAERGCPEASYRHPPRTHSGHLQSLSAAKRSRLLSLPEGTEGSNIKKLLELSLGLDGKSSWVRPVNNPVRRDHLWPVATSSRPLMGASETHRSPCPISPSPKPTAFLLLLERTSRWEGEFQSHRNSLRSLLSYIKRQSTQTLEACAESQIMCYVRPHRWPIPSPDPIPRSGHVAEHLALPGP